MAYGCEIRLQPSSPSLLVSFPRCLSLGIPWGPTVACSIPFWSSFACASFLPPSSFRRLVVSSPRRLVASPCRLTASSPSSLSPRRLASAVRSPASLVSNLGQEVTLPTRTIECFALGRQRCRPRSPLPVESVDATSMAALAVAAAATTPLPGPRQRTALPRPALRGCGGRAGCLWA